MRKTLLSLSLILIVIVGLTLAKNDYHNHQSKLRIRKLKLLLKEALQIQTRFRRLFLDHFKRQEVKKLYDDKIRQLVNNLKDVHVISSRLR
jgi:hypothetical protein